MVTHKMFHFLLYDVIPHYHNSDKFRIPSDHFRQSTFQLFPKINLCIVRAEGRPYYLTTFKVSIAYSSCYAVVAIHNAGDLCLLLQGLL